jgi:hypothetical protein
LVLLLLLVGGVAGALVSRGGRNSTSSTSGQTTAATAGPVTAAASNAATASAAASAGSASQVPAVRPVTVGVVRSGFTQLPREPDGDVKTSWAVLLRNPANDRVALDVRVFVTLRNRAGQAVATDDKKLDVLLPGQLGAVGERSDASGVTKMDVTISATSTAASGAGGALSANAVRTFRTADGETHTTATVHSTFPQPVDVEAVAVWYNGAGRVIGSDSDSVDSVGQAGVVARIDTSSAPPGIARTEVYPTLKDFPPGS